MADRERILAAAQAIGNRKGWKAVTIRAVADELGYTSPVLYEHFRDKEDLLTQIAVRTIDALHASLSESVGTERFSAVRRMVASYWELVIVSPQLYRLMSGMDGVPIDRKVVNRAALPICNTVGNVLRGFVGESATEAEVLVRVDELWALLHGMATLYLDRSARFDVDRVTQAAFRLIGVTEMQGKHELG